MKIDTVEGLPDIALTDAISDIILAHADPQPHRPYRLALAISSGMPTDALVKELRRRGGLVIEVPDE